MSDTADALTQARAEAAAWQERIAELEAQQPPQTAAPVEPIGQIAGPPPRALVQELHARAMLNGAREEDAAALIFNAMAQRAKAGDPRFIVREDGSFFRDGVDG